MSQVWRVTARQSPKSLDLIVVCLIQYIYSLRIVSVNTAPWTGGVSTTFRILTHARENGRTAQAANDWSDLQRARARTTEVGFLKGQRARAMQQQEGILA